MNVQVILNIIIYTFLYLTIAISFSIIYFTTKIFHFAHAAIFSLGAYFLFFLVQKFSPSLVISVIISVFAAALVGVLCDFIVYRQLRNRNAPTSAYLIASTGLFIILQNFISIYFGDDVKIIRIGLITVGNEIFGAYITNIQIIIVVVSIILFISSKLFLSYSKTGKSIRAVSNNPLLSNIYGIDSGKIIYIAFGIGSAIAAIAGILSAMDRGLTPFLGINLLFNGVVVMIIGGVGSFNGLIRGALLVATAQNFVSYYFGTRWVDAIAYVLLIIFLIWKPEGFDGTTFKKKEV